MFKKSQLPKLLGWLGEARQISVKGGNRRYTNVVFLCSYDFVVASRKPGHWPGLRGESYRQSEKWMEPCMEKQ